MTRLENLRALRDAVKAGTATMPLATACYPRDADGRMLDDRKGWHDANVMGAYQGSLDAAHALHKAVLPDYSPIMFGDGVQVHLSVSSIIRDEYEVVPGNPARAWLLAILAALIATEEGKGEG